MIGLGTIINVAAIVVGGTIGLFGKKLLKDDWLETVQKANAVAVIFLGMAGSLSKMLVIEDGALQSQGTMLMILSLVLGALVGSILNLEKGFENLGAWLKKKSGSENDVGFIDAFVTASLTVCIGAMAIIGSIQDGLSGDYSTLAAKAVLDFAIILIMAGAMGKGAIFSAVPVGIVQGSMTLIARLIAPLMTTPVLNNISLVGNILIFCVGVNLIKPRTFKTANLLPALIFAAAFTGIL